MRTYVDMVKNWAVFLFVGALVPDVLILSTLLALVFVS